jgi:hypothetical protein
MSGMLIQLAAATAEKGTRRPTRGGILFTREFRPEAVKVLQIPVHKIALTYRIPVALMISIISFRNWIRDLFNQFH